MKWNLIKNVNVWCFSPCILEVDAADAVFSQTPWTEMGARQDLHVNVLYIG